MSDYIYSASRQQPGKLAACIKDIYMSAAPKVFEYHGNWGSLAVSQQHYNGFLPYENERHICLVIGAPVLYFTDNDFLTQEDTNTASRNIYNRWVVENKMQWAEDLSGPFTVLLIDKQSNEVCNVIDLMSFIPVYYNTKNSKLWLGTHVDALAKACDEQQNYDEVSLSDFILNGVVTFPHTVYKQISQLKPGTEYLWKNNAVNDIEKTYWLPNENCAFSSINQAAAKLRTGIQGYIATVTQNMPKLAQFTSAGEDSRALSGILPQEKPRDAYIFLDQMNREGKIAAKVSKIYQAEFKPGFRSKIHYLEIMPEACKLIGTGHQYIHAHSLGFDKKFKLAEYPAVFGGYLSDSLLKGRYVPKVRGAGRFPFLPQFAVKRSPVGEHFRRQGSLINYEIIQEVNSRQQQHLTFISAIRPTTANEWFALYPTSMRMSIPNFYSSRRLFKSYEPFLSHESVKISASVPTSWKLNRRLFKKAMKPYLKPSKWLFHADGRLPYFSWWVNMPIQFCIWSYRQIAKYTGLIKGNQGPWGEWNVVFASHEWESWLEYLSAKNTLNIFTKDTYELGLSSKLTENQKVNLMQVLYQLQH